MRMTANFEGNKENARNLREILAQLPRQIRFAIEFRHRDWMIDWTFRELEKRQVALCLCEGSWIPREMMFEAGQKIKTPFSYTRFMGERDLESFDKIYRHQDANLDIWADQIKNIPAPDKFIYFSNFYEGHAPASADKLKALFGQEIIETESMENQGSLFPSKFGGI